MLIDSVFCNKCLTNKCLSNNADLAFELAAAVGCRRARCVELSGTEKQIKWAEVIRYAHLIAIDEYRYLIIDKYAENESLRKKALLYISKNLKWLKGISESKWWIENHANSFKTELRNIRFWRGCRDNDSIFMLAMKILLISPHMNKSAAIALDLEVRWNEFVTNKAIAEKAAKALADRIVAHEKTKPELIARARALSWHGTIKPWWNGEDHRLFLNDMGNCSICWFNGNFDKTVRFWRMDDTPEARQLAKEIWRWCMQKPNTDIACSLELG